MPHFKCVACKIRLSGAAGAADPVGDLCPGCGSPLEPVGELADIVGFQSVKSRDYGADGSAPGAHQQIAARVHDLIALQGAIRADAPLDAGRRLDDGDRR
jgi:hypothetical protein